MNVVFQIFLLVTVVTVTLCSDPPAAQVGLRLVQKVHKLYKAGLVDEDVVTDACTLSGPALLACQATPAAPGCDIAGAACGIYSAGRWIWDHTFG